MALHEEGAILAEYTVKPDGTGSFQASLVLPILLVFFPSLPSSSLLSSLHKGQCSIVIESSGSRDNRWLYMELSALPLTGEVFLGDVVQWPRTTVSSSLQGNNTWLALFLVPEKCM